MAPAERTRFYSRVTTDEFRKEMNAQLRRAAKRGAPYVEINSGELHRSVGGYPSTNHRMPMCCEAMHGEQRAADVVISRPPSGKGATPTIRYKLPWYLSNHAA
jgi:hypothetical protein